MTDITDNGRPSAAAPFAYAIAEDSWRGRLQLAAEIRPANQTRLMAALAAAGVVEVTVAFDGCGDSGQIESIDARDAAGEVALPDVGVEITTIADDSLETRMAVMPLRQTVEALAYELLEDAHDGWEINDGAYGEFIFDVAQGVIRLDYNERFVDSQYYQHSW